MLDHEQGFFVNEDGSDEVGHRANPKTETKPVK
jgi:hypothetical protein